MRASIYVSLLFAAGSFVALIPQTADAAESCRDDARAAVSAARDYQQAARDVSHACTKSDQSGCDSAEAMIPDAVTQLLAANETMLNSCGILPPPPVPPVNPSDLVITEIMVNPFNVSDNEGEWFELFNMTSNFIELQGLTVSDDGIDMFVIDTSLIVAPAGFVVLGRNSNSAVNGGVTIDFEYGVSFTLANTVDEINIAFDGLIIDIVAYGSGWPTALGKALNLDPAFTNAMDNDDLLNWCVATTELPSGDKGTPGIVNDNC